MSNLPVMVDSRSRPWPALVAGLLLLVSARPAQAGAELSGVEVAEVREAEHALSVRIEGLLAHVETRQVVVNPADRDSEAIYAFDLPADAAVLGAEIALPDGRRAESSAVDARAAFRFVPDDGAASGAPDLGLLRLLSVDDDRNVARYELRIYPVPAGRAATAIVRWAAPVRYRDGRLSLRLPDRGGAPNLVRERVELMWRAPPGAHGLRDIRPGSARLASTSGPTSATLRLHAPVGDDLVLEATPQFRRGHGLVGEVAVVPLDRNRGAVALSLLAPDLPAAPAPRFDRVVLVLDRSRSLGASGMAATRAIAEAMVAAANQGAAMDAVVFDRRARPLVGRLVEERAGLRAHLARGLASSASESGSDLGSALGAAANLLRRAGPPRDAPIRELSAGPTSRALIVILTDGMLPLRFDGERARSQLGTLAAAESRVVSVVLVPDGAPIPDLEHGPLADLARATGGRVLAVRHGQAGARAPRLWAEVGQPAPFDGIQIDWRTRVVTSSAQAPARLESGEGFLLLGWYHGARPDRIRVRAQLRGRAVAAQLRPARGPLTRAALPLAVVQRPAVELLAPAALVGADVEDRARAELVRAAHRAGTASRATALVLLDPRDRFAQDRIAHARRWGTGQYRRFPPPAERRMGEVPTRDVAERAATPIAARPRRTGELDRRLVERLMKQHVVPRARDCYQRALRRQPRLAGTVVIELEMARGEVQHAHVARATAASALLSGCLIDAAYATPVPSVALGDARESIVVARYPLRFRRTDEELDVSQAPE